MTNQTNQERIETLLDIAVKNGWEDTTNGCYYLLKDSPLLLWNWRTHADSETYSINDLVSTWEPGKVSFIEALCRADDSRIDDWASDNETYHTYFDLHINLIRDYNSQPTSKRLNWLLFETFNHLLTEN